MAIELSIPEIHKAVWPVLAQRVSERAASAVDLLEDLLRAEGQLRRRDHELLAGDRVLNGDRDLLARISRATGLGISLYLGNRRVASFSTLAAGAAHDLGGYADAQLVETVLRKGEAFRGVLEFDVYPVRPVVFSGRGVVQKLGKTVMFEGRATAAGEGSYSIEWAEGQPPLTATSAASFGNGQACHLAIRPEKVTISAERPADAVNAVQGKVHDIAYLGNLSTYHVELPNGTIIKAQTANTRRISRRSFTWEDPVWLSWTATAAVLLAD